MRVPDWTKKYSIESSGPVMRTLSPVSSPTSRRAVSSVVSPLFGVPLGKGPGSPVAFATSTSHDEPRLTVFVADDDAAGRRGGRGPQARHGADAALGRRIAPPCPDRAQCMTTRGCGRPSCDRAPTAGWIDRHRPRRLTNGATSGRRSTVARSAVDRNTPPACRPSRRSFVRTDGRTKWAAGRAAYLAAIL